MFDLLKKISNITKEAVEAAPAVQGITTALKTVNALSGNDPEKRKELLLEMAADFADISAEILRALKDGVITDDEFREIMKQVSQLSVVGQ